MMLLQLHTIFGELGETSLYLRAPGPMLGREHWITVMRPPMGCCIQTHKHNNIMLHTTVLQGGKCVSQTQQYHCMQQCCKEETVYHNHNNIVCNNVARRQLFITNMTISLHATVLQGGNCVSQTQQCCKEDTMYHTTIYVRTRSFVAACNAAPSALRSDLFVENIRGRSSISERKIYRTSSPTQNASITESQSAIFTHLLELLQVDQQGLWTRKEHIWGIGRYTMLARARHNTLQ